MQPEFDPGLNTADQFGERSDHILVSERSVRRRTLRNVVHQIIQQAGLGIQEILPELNVREPTFVLEQFGSETIVSLRLLQVGAVAGAIQGQFAVHAAAGGTDAAMQRRTETLFFASLAENAAQADRLLSSSIRLIQDSSVCSAAFFGFFTAAAGTRLVASDLGRGAANGCRRVHARQRRQVLLGSCLPWVAAFRLPEALHPPHSPG